MKPRWYVVLAAVLLIAVGIAAIKSLIDPSDDAAPLPFIGPAMPPGYAVDWVPVGDRTYPCVAYYRSVSCDFSRPSPTPTP